MSDLHNLFHFCIILKSTKMNEIISKRIKSLRLIKGYSQDYVADKLCITQSAYARLENGDTYSWATYLEKLCEIFEVKPEDIVTNNEIVINQKQTGGNSNNAYIINQLSEKLIEQYEKRLEEKDITINYLKQKMKNLEDNKT